MNPLSITKAVHKESDRFLEQAAEQLESPFLDGTSFVIKRRCTVELPVHLNLYPRHGIVAVSPSDITTGEWRIDRYLIFRQFKHLPETLRECIYHLAGGCISANIAEADGRPGSSTIPRYGGRNG